MNKLIVGDPACSYATVPTTTTTNCYNGSILQGHNCGVVVGIIVLTNSLENYGWC